MSELSTEVVYQKTVVAQHDEIISALRSLETATHASSSNVRVALDNMRSSLANALKVPVAVAMIGAVSWLFETGKIQERTWTLFCLVSMFPWFGDSIRIVFDIFRGDKNDTKEKITAGLKLVGLGSLIALLFNT